MKSKKQTAKGKKPNRSGPKGIMGGSAGDYYRMLADPCAGPLGVPPYGSTDSGYVVRTVEVLTIQGTTGYSGLTIGASTPIDFILQYTPGAYAITNNPGLAYNGAKPGQNQTVTIQASTSWPVNNTAVRKFRAIAGCVKVLPNGAYSTRQGTIALGYSSGQMLTSGSTVTTSANLSSLLLETAPTGAKMHEIRWLPTETDQLWADPNNADATLLGGGTILVSGASVDGYAVSATVAQANVIIEITTVWEWLPSYTTSIANIPRTPSPYTIQDVLSRIKDIGGFVLGNYDKVSKYFAMGLDYGVRQYVRTAPSVPLIMSR